MGGEGVEGAQAGAGQAHVFSCESAGPERPLAAPSALLTTLLRAPSFP